MKIFICVRLTIFSAKMKSVLIIYWVPHKVYKVFVRQVFKYFNMFKGLKYVYISTPIAKNKNYLTIPKCCLQSYSSILKSKIADFVEFGDVMTYTANLRHVLQQYRCWDYIRRSHSCIHGKLDCMVRFTGAKQLYKQLMQWFCLWLSTSYPGFAILDTDHLSIYRWLYQYIPHIPLS